jgi:predicted nucleic acid-binding protein
VILVLDSSPLIALARINRLPLIPQLAERVYVPKAVYEEVAPQRGSPPGSIEIREARWISVVQVRNQMAVGCLQHRVGRGEAEAIILAQEIQTDFLVLDDATARRLAESQNVRVIGLLGLLLHAKHHGHIDTIKSVLDDLKSAGFFIDESLYREILRQAGEGA